MQPLAPVAGMTAAVVAGALVYFWHVAGRPRQVLFWALGMFLAATFGLLHAAAVDWPVRQILADMALVGAATLILAGTMTLLAAGRSAVWTLAVPPLLAGAWRFLAGAFDLPSFAVRAPADWAFCLLLASAAWQLASGGEGDRQGRRLLAAVLLLWGANQALWPSMPALAGVQTGWIVFNTPLIAAAGLLFVFTVLRAQQDAERQAFEALRVSEARLRAIFEYTPVCLNLKDTRGRYLMLNPPYEAWLGQRAEDVVGKSAMQFLDRDPHEVINLDATEKEVLRTGRPVEREVRVRRGDKVHDRMLIKFPTIDSDGTVVGLGTVAIDITERKAAEAALAAEKERAARFERLLRDAIDVMPAGFAIFDEADRLVVCNAEYMVFNPLYKAAPEAAIGQHFGTLLGEAVGAGAVEELQTASERDAYIAERMRRHREATGEPFEQRFGDRVVMTSETRIASGGSIVHRQDITLLRRAEEARADTEALLRNLFDNASPGILVKDRQTRLLRANKAALEQYGRPLEAILGRTTIEILTDIGWGDRAEIAAAEEMETMESRRPGDVVVRMVDDKGAERFYRVSRFPLIGQDDEVIGIGIMRYDITEVLAAQKALEQAKAELEQVVAERTEALGKSERRFRHLASASADWFWELDADNRFTFVSDRFPVPPGWTRDQVIGMRAADLHRALGIDPEISRQLVEAYERRLPLRDIEVERPKLTDDRIIRLNSVPVWDRGVFVGYVGAATDITELKEAQRGLIEAERLASLGALVAGIAHEINTPIGICVTASSIVELEAGNLRRLVESGEVRRSELNAAVGKIFEGSELIGSNLARAADLISSFKRVAVDQTSEVEREFDLPAYLREVLQSLSPQLRKSGANVEVTGSDSVWLVSYPGAIAQILTNLVMNSLIHGFDKGPGGAISVDVSTPSNDVSIRYRDNGPGMDEETLRRMYDPFFTTRRGQGGSGLGMHIVFNLVTQILRGTVQCKSAPGSGVEFEIRFPRVEREAR